MGWLFGKKDDDCDIIDVLFNAPTDIADKAFEATDKGFDLADRLADKVLGR